MLIEALPWDSDFFGMRVGVVRPLTFSYRDFVSERDAFDLVYIYELPGEYGNADIEKVCGPPVDTKVTYKKKLDSEITCPSGIESYLSPEPDERLLALVLQSGIHSRFQTDKRFPKGSFEKLYTTWIRRCLDKSMACSVYVYLEHGAPPQGFITLEIKADEIYIGLIAVDSIARGKGIGTRLIRAAESEAHLRNFLYLKVSTQTANWEACRLYEKCGFAVDETVHIYHYWKT